MEVSDLQSQVSYLQSISHLKVDVSQLHLRDVSPPICLTCNQSVSLQINVSHLQLEISQL